MINSISLGKDFFGKSELKKSEKESETQTLEALTLKGGSEDGVVIDLGNSPEADPTYSLQQLGDANAILFARSRLRPQSKVDFAVVDKYWEKKLDTDGSGVISHDEVEAFQAEHPGEIPSHLAGQLPVGSENDANKSLGDVAKGTSASAQTETDGNSNQSVDQKNLQVGQQTSQNTDAPSLEAQLLQTIDSSVG